MDGILGSILAGYRGSMLDDFVGVKILQVYDWFVDCPKLCVCLSFAKGSVESERIVDSNSDVVSGNISAVVWSCMAVISLHLGYYGS